MTTGPDAFREQLSAFLDGELDRDAARFLRARLAHDRALGDTAQRWQLLGDALRSQAAGAPASALHPAVMQAIAAEARPPVVADRVRWSRRLGGLAAALALGVLFWPDPVAMQGPRQPDLAAVSGAAPIGPGAVVVAISPIDPPGLASPAPVEPLPEPRVIGRPWPRAHPEGHPVFTVGYRAPDVWPVGSHPPNQAAGER